MMYRVGFIIYGVFFIFEVFWFCVIIEEVNCFFYGDKFSFNFVVLLENDKFIYG